jgi:hypothetical protein
MSREQYAGLTAPPPPPPPPAKTSTRRVAVIPIRDRAAQLAKLVPKLLGMKFDLVVICEQGKTRAFNRGLVKNIGFLLADVDPSDTVYFHDVDLLPNMMRGYPLASCDGITHLYGHQHCLGGIVGMRACTFREIGGFCNDQWSWGGEDRGLQMAATAHHKTICRDYFTARFTDDNRIREMDIEGGVMSGVRAKRLFNASVGRLKRVPTRTVYEAGLPTARQKVVRTERIRTGDPRVVHHVVDL